MKDWRGDKEQEFVDLCELWTEIFKKPNIATLYGWNSNRMDSTMGAIHAFLVAAEKYKQVPLRENCDAKNAAKKIALRAVSDFANTDVRYNPEMTNEQKKAMHVRVRDKINTPGKPPSDALETVVTYTNNPHEMKVTSYIYGTHSKKKPADAHGMKTKYQIGGEKPESPEAMSKDKFSLGMSVVIPFTEAQAGLPVYYSTRLENLKGDGGPWSDIVTKIIG